jgi:hypothetical protein
MSELQIAYMSILAVLTIPAWKVQRYALLWLWANLLSMLAAAYAMDIGLLDRTMATLTMLVVDCATGAGLALRPGAARLIAWGYAVTVPIYSLNLVFGVPIGSTFGIIYIAAFAQLGMLCLGSSGGFGGGSRRGRSAFHPSVEISGGNQSLPGQPISCYIGQDRVQG